VKEDIALLQTFNINRKAIEMSIDDFQVQYFQDVELYRNSPIELEDIEIKDKEILKRRVILIPTDGDSFHLMVEKSILDRVKIALDREVMELKSREFHYGESVDTRYFKV